MIWYVLVSNEEKISLMRKKKLTGIFTVDRLCIFEDIVV